MALSKLYLSSSSMQMFLSCKRKFRYRYLDKISATKPVVNKYISFGNSIHAALAQFNSITHPNNRTLQNLHMLLRKNWRREGYDSVEEERKFGLKALTMLTEYYGNPLEQGQRNLIIEEMINKDMDGKFVLCGKLDKVYIREDSLIETIDYKTGNTIERVNALQLPVYILLTHEKLQTYPGIVSYYYLTNNKKVEQTIDLEIIGRVTEMLWKIYEDIVQEHRFECNPTKYCQKTCEYYDICDDAKDVNKIILNELEFFRENQEYEIVF